MSFVKMGGERELDWEGEERDGVVSEEGRMEG